MIHGTISAIDDDHGSGFIVPDDGTPAVYFHMSQVHAGAFDLLRLGQRVQVQTGPEPGDRARVRAERVRPLDWRRAAHLRRRQRGAGLGPDPDLGCDKRPACGRPLRARSSASLP